MIENCKNILKHFHVSLHFDILFFQDLYNDPNEDKQTIFHVIRVNHTHKQRQEGCNKPKFQSEKSLNCNRFS